MKIAKTVSCFAFFSSQFFHEKKAGLSLFLRHSKSIELEFSPHILDTVWGGCLFFLFKKISFRWFFVALRKKLFSKKHAFFFGCLLYFDCFIRKTKDTGKPKQKNTHPKQCLVPFKKVSSRSDVVCWRNGAKIGVILRHCEPSTP